MEIYARRVVVQEGLECPFAPALAAQPDVRAAGSTKNPAAKPMPAAAAKFTQAAMRKQIVALHRELSALQESEVFASKQSQALERSPGDGQLATPQPGAKVTLRVPKPPGRSVG